MEPFQSFLVWLFSGATVLSWSGRISRWIGRSWKGDVETLVKKVEESDELHGALVKAFGSNLRPEFLRVIDRIRRPLRVKLARRLLQIDELHKNPQRNGRLLVGSSIMIAAAGVASIDAPPWVAVTISLGGVFIAFPHYVEMFRREKAIKSRARSEAEDSLLSSRESDFGEE